MDYLRKTVHSNTLVNFRDLPKNLQNRMVDVIILPAETEDQEPRNYACRIGFYPGPEVPDSFFEPLSEEELALWEKELPV